MIEHVAVNALTMSHPIGLHYDHMIFSRHVCSIINNREFWMVSFLKSYIVNVISSCQPQTGTANEGSACGLYNAET